MEKIDCKKRRKMNDDVINSIINDENTSSKKLWDIKNREKRINYNKEYYNKNKEKIIKQVCENQKIKRSVINEKRKENRKNKKLLEIQSKLLLTKSELKLVTIDDWHINY